jgi:glycerol-3-phosphate acyltransferase PlsY
MNAWQTIAVTVLAYLVGSTSFAWIFAKRLKGIDLRTVGSGNLGATNAGRLLGHRIAILIYFLDFAKGFVPVFVLKKLCADQPASLAVPVALLAGLAAFAGHCFPIWHGLRGGKGVATASGVIVGWTPLAALAVISVFALAVALSRRISAGSILAAVALPIAQLVFCEGSTEAARRWTLFVYLGIATLVIARHHQNLRRLLKGEEPAIGRRLS